MKKILLALPTLMLATTGFADSFNSALANGATAAHPSSARGLAPQAGGFVPMATKMNGPGARLAYRLDAKVQLGRATPVSLQVRAPVDTMVSLRVPEGVSLAGTAEFKVLAGKSVVLPLSFSVQREGSHAVYVETKALSGAQAGQASVSGFLLAVGQAQPLKAAGTLSTTPKGEQVISMPAREN